MIPRKTPQNGTFILLKFFVLFNSYELKINKINISSFNFSTSPQAIKHYILLVGPRFYQPRATGLAEMSNPAVGQEGWQSYLFVAVT